MQFAFDSSVMPTTLNVQVSGRISNDVTTTLESGTWQLVLQPYDPTTTDAERARYNVRPLAQLQEGPPGGLNSPLLLVLVQVLVLVGLVRLAWLGVRWLWRATSPHDC
jgi:hypothetical protein